MMIISPLIRLQKWITGFHVRWSTKVDSDFLFTDSKSNVSTLLFCSVHVRGRYGCCSLYACVYACFRAVMVQSREVGCQKSKSLVRKAWAPRVYNVPLPTSASCGHTNTATHLNQSHVLQLKKQDLRTGFFPTDELKKVPIGHS